MSYLITYTDVNGYLIPNLTYKSGEQMEQLGKYGFLRRDYLKNHRNSTYQVMPLQDTIGEHLLEVDKAAREREEVILKQLEEKEPLPDKEAEKKMEQAEAKARNEKKRAEMEILKTKKEVKARTEKMRDAEYFWGIGYITVILFAIIQNGAFQHDFIDFFGIPFTWYVRFCE